MKKKLFPYLYKRIKALKPWQMIAGAIGVVLIAIYLYSILGSSNVVLNVSSLESRVVVGVPFEIKTSVKNISRNVLLKAKLSLSLPAGLVFADSPSLKISTVNLGDVPSNGNHEETYKVVAIPTANLITIEPVATLSYSLGSIKGIFEQKEKLPLEIADLGLDIQMTTPEKVTSGEPFDIKTIYSRSNIYALEAENIPVLKLQFDYPSVLVPTYSVPKSENGDNAPKKLDSKTFTLGVLMPGDSGAVHLNGSVDLPENSNFKITASILINILGRDYVLVSRDWSATLSSAPLSVALYDAVNNLPGADSPKIVLNAGDTVNYSLVYKNQTDIAFLNVTLKVKLTGAMYDFNSVSAGSGSWNGATRTISWDSSNLQEFISIPPGSTGNINFTVKLLSTYPIRRLNDKNFSVNADARIESPTVQKDAHVSKTSSSFSLNNKVSGRIIVDARGFFRDAASLILNDGPWPPKVNTPTDFTIHWVLTNYSTDLTNIEARAELPDGYVFTGVVKGSTPSLPQFDENTGQVSWKIDKLYATQGITSDSPEAIFQVRAIPFAVGDYAPILGATTVTAMDSFTGLQITSVDDPITTRLPDDPSVKENDGKVVN